MRPTWDVKTMCQELSTQVKRFEPLLEQVKPSEWKESGESYSGQLQALKDEVGYVQRTALELAGTPDSMTKALELFLRIQAVESMIVSVSDGVRRHQNPAVADLMQGVLNEVGPYTQAVQGYLVEIVTLKENELKIVDAEAQKCRASLVGSK